MFSFVSCASRCLALWSSMSCESRSAQASPAGPPPTMTTSASICGRSMSSSGLRKTSMQFRVSSFEFQAKLWNSKLTLGLLDLFYQRRYYIEEASDDGVVRDLEYRRF